MPTSPRERCGQGDDLPDNGPGVEQPAVVGAVRLIVPVRVVDDLQPHMGGQGEELLLQRRADLRRHTGLGDSDARLQQRPGGQEGNDEQKLRNGRADPVRGRPLREQLAEHRHGGHEAESCHRGRCQLKKYDCDRRAAVRVPGQLSDLAHDPRKPREDLVHRGLGRGTIVDGPVRLLQPVGDVAVVRAAGNGGGRQGQFPGAWSGHRAGLDVFCGLIGAHAPHLTVDTACSTHHPASATPAPAPGHTRDHHPADARPPVARWTARTPPAADCPASGCLRRRGTDATTQRVVRQPY